ncbi:MAG: class I SAM-dependent methyltransferase [Hyphomicrobiales bacterium]|nr:class I SAM-dependent methyltransferase [Hyphomicrobiales bacterium]
MQNMLSRLVAQMIQTGDLTLIFADGKRQKFGDGKGVPLQAEFMDARGPFDLLRNPELALGELYTDGRLVMRSGSIYDLLALVAVCDVRFNPPALISAFRTARDAARFLRGPNERAGARANVAHHYDLDARLYRLFLDEDQQYSCAYFQRPDQTLDEAQTAKKRRIAAKLLLEKDMRVLDIGSGWGGMALYLAQNCGARVDGATLSLEQFEAAKNRAAEANLTGQVQFLMRDYRDIEGTYDRIVSVGMFEHVGAAHFGTFFEKMRALMTRDSVALLHTIGRPDGPGETNPWIRKYIFPGGYIPSLSEIAAAVEKAGLFITDIEVWRMHYAETLRHWRERFLARRAEAAALYDERFCRMWEFYLALAEIGFRFEGECVFHLQLTRRHDAAPITRDYIAAAEARLKAAGG